MSFIHRVSAVVRAFVARPVVQSVARHAAIAAVAVVVAAVSVGGVRSVTAGVIIAAAAAAGRVVWAAVSAWIGPEAPAAPPAAPVEKPAA